MAIYDLPAMIDYIILKTNVEKITYFGHSQGTLQVFVGMTLIPDYFNRTLNGIIALGPVTSMANIGSNFLYFTAKTDLDNILAFLGFKEFLPNMKAFNELNSLLCDKLHLICNGLLELIADSNAYYDDQDKMPVFLAHFPSGTSLKDISHFAQFVRNKNFAQFDYGKVKNLEIYGNSIPPEYNLNKIRNKICLFVGTDDRLATTKDNRIFKEILSKNGNLVWYKEYDNMGHLTFFVPKDFSYNNDIMNCVKEFEK